MVSRLLRSVHKLFLYQILVGFERFERSNVAILCRKLQTCIEKRNLTSDSPLTELCTSKSLHFFNILSTGLLFTIFKSFDQYKFYGTSCQKFFS